MKIPVSHGHLEALLREPDETPRAAAVVCHPHPLHGGTMHTKAVHRMAHALVGAGIVSLRFNFRGVGTSTGSYEDGIGEREDVTAALDWLEGRYPHLPLVVAGFSFGSMVGLSVGVDDDRVVSLLGAGLALDLRRFDYGFLEGSDKPLLVVQGENDEFGAGQRIAELLAELGPSVTLVRIPDCDHYFTGRLDALEEAIRGYYASGPGSRLLAVV